MKSALIVTPYGLNNYGNRLQNYALSKTLELKGYDCRTVVHKPSQHRKHGFKESLKPILWSGFNQSVRAKRYRAFRAFDKRIKKVITQDRKQLEQVASNADIVCIGSDQIWNPYHINDPYFQFALFAKAEKKISYAASFGISKIPPEFVEEFREGLQSIRSISVREHQGAEIVKKLTSKDAQVVSDPVLLLNANSWALLGDEALIPSQPYIFSYFLGKNAESDKDRVREFCRNNGYTDVELMSLGHPDHYYAGPQDFISLIRHSSLVCTNSYHAALFSIIFQKRLNIFERIDSKELSMGSRISELIHQYGLSKCCVQAVDDSVDLPYEQIQKALDERRQASLLFLEDALSERGSA